MSDSLEKEKHSFRIMVKYVNAYIKSKEAKDFLEIEKELKHFFKASDVKLWYCDRDTKALREFGKKDNSSLAMEMSLTEKVINSKKPLIENHIMSNKYFNLSIDNPLELKVKSLLMFPIVRHKKVIGIVRIWRGMKQRNNFSKKDEESLGFFQTIFLALIESISIDKERLLSIVGKEPIAKNAIIEEVKKELPSKPKTQVKQAKIKLKDKALEVLETKYTVLKKEKLAEEKSFQKEEKALKEDIADYKVKLSKVLKDCEEKTKRTYDEAFEKALQEGKLKLQDIEKVKNEEIQNLREGLNRANVTITDNDNILKKVQEELLSAIQKYQTLEAIGLKAQRSQELEEQKQKQNLESLESLEREVKVFKLENKALSKEVKELKIIKTPTSIRALKLQQRQENIQTSVISMDNIEYLLEYFDKNFRENEYSYSCFEMIIYALSSNKGMSDIDEILRKNQILSAIIDSYYFKGNLIVNNERHTLTNFVKHLNSYEKNIFNNSIKVNISVAKEMPKSFIFDRIKIQSILLHLFNDLEKLMDKNKMMELKINLNDKYLRLELGGIIHQKTTIFTSMFKQTELAMDNQDRVSLQLSRKIIERLKGNLDFSYDNAYYKFILNIPVQVIKI